MSAVLQEWLGSDSDGRSAPMDRQENEVPSRTFGAQAGPNPFVAVTASVTKRLEEKQLKGVAAIHTDAVTNMKSHASPNPLRLDPRETLKRQEMYDKIYKMLEGSLYARAFYFSPEYLHLVTNALLDSDACDERKSTGDDASSNATSKPSPLPQGWLQSPAGNSQNSDTRSGEQVSNSTELSQGELEEVDPCFDCDDVDTVLPPTNEPYAKEKLPLLLRCRAYWTSERSKIMLYSLFWLGVIGFGLFYGLTFYYGPVFPVLGYWIVFAKTAAGVMYWCMAVVFLPVCYGLIAALQTAHSARVLLPLAKAQQFHITCACTFVAASIVHSFCHLAGTFRILANFPCSPGTKSPPWCERSYVQLLLATIPGLTGVLLLAIFLAMLFTSTQSFRNQRFPVFYRIHQAFFVAVILLCIHGTGEWVQVTHAWRYVGFSFLLYLFDRGVRMVQAFRYRHFRLLRARIIWTNPAHADDVFRKALEVAAKERLASMKTETHQSATASGMDGAQASTQGRQDESELVSLRTMLDWLLSADNLKPAGESFVVLELARPQPLDRFVFKAGQYVLVQIPCLSRQWHPFTISSSPTDPSVLRLHIKVIGWWTQSLRRLVLMSAIKKLVSGCLASIDNTNRPHAEQRFTSESATVSSGGEMRQSRDKFLSFSQGVYPGSETSHVSQQWLPLSDLKVLDAASMRKPVMEATSPESSVTGEEIEILVNGPLGAPTVSLQAAIKGEESFWTQILRHSPMPLLSAILSLPEARLFTFNEVSTAPFRWPGLGTPTPLPSTRASKSAMIESQHVQLALRQMLLTEEESGSVEIEPDLGGASEVKVGADNQTPAPYPAIVHVSGNGGSESKAQAGDDGEKSIEQAPSPTSSGVSSTNQSSVASFTSSRVANGAKRVPVQPLDGFTEVSPGCGRIYPDSHNHLADAPLPQSGFTPRATPVSATGVPKTPYQYQHRLEGRYPSSGQIMVAAGIGVTPFISALEYTAMSLHLSRAPTKVEPLALLKHDGKLQLQVSRQDDTEGKRNSAAQQELKLVPTDATNPSQPERGSLVTPRGPSSTALRLSSPHVSMSASLRAPFTPSRGSTPKILTHRRQHSSNGSSLISPHHEPMSPRLHPGLALLTWQRNYFNAIQRHLVTSAMPVLKPDAKLASKLEALLLSPLNANSGTPIHGVTKALRRAASSAIRAARQRHSSRVSALTPSVQEECGDLEDPVTPQNTEDPVKLVLELKPKVKATPMKTEESRVTGENKSKGAMKIEAKENGTTIAASERNDVASTNARKRTKSVVFAQTSETIAGGISENPVPQPRPRRKPTRALAPKQKQINARVSTKRQLTKSGHGTQFGKLWSTRGLAIGRADHTLLERNARRLNRIAQNRKQRKQELVSLIQAKRREARQKVLRLTSSSTSVVGSNRNSSESLESSGSKNLKVHVPSAAPQHLSERRATTPYSRLLGSASVHSRDHDILTDGELVDSSDETIGEVSSGSHTAYAKSLRTVGTQMSMPTNPTIPLGFGCRSSLDLVWTVREFNHLTMFHAMLNHLIVFSSLTQPKPPVSLSGSYRSAPRQSDACLSRWLNPLADVRFNFRSTIFITSKELTRIAADPRPVLRAIKTLERLDPSALASGERTNMTPRDPSPNGNTEETRHDVESARRTLSASMDTFIYAADAASLLLLHGQYLLSSLRKANGRSWPSLTHWVPCHGELTTDSNRRVYFATWGTWVIEFGRPDKDFFTQLMIPPKGTIVQSLATSPEETYFERDEGSPLIVLGKSTPSHAEGTSRQLSAGKPVVEIEGVRSVSTYCCCPRELSKTVYAAGRDAMRTEDGLRVSFTKECF